MLTMICVVYVFERKGPILLSMCVLFQVIFGHEKVTILLTRIVGVYFLIWDGPHFVNHGFWIRRGPHIVNKNFWCQFLFDVGSFTIGNFAKKNIGVFYQLVTVFDAVRTEPEFFESL